MKRIFFGVNIPVTDRIREFYNNTKIQLEEEKIKWVPPENLHITLLFMGDTEESYIPQIIDKASIDQQYRNAFSLKINGLGVFKNYSRPRVIWMGIDPEPVLESLKFSIDKQIKELGFDVEETDKFRPHLTIGRVKNMNDRNHLKEVVEERKNEPVDQIEISNFYLYESTLTKKGPIYNVLHTFNLGE